MEKVQVGGDILLHINGEHRTTSTEYSQAKGAIRNAVRQAVEICKADLARRGFGDRVTVSADFCGMVDGEHYDSEEVGDNCEE